MHSRKGRTEGADASEGQGLFFYLRGTSFYGPPQHSLSLSPQTPTSMLMPPARRTVSQVANRLVLSAPALCPVLALPPSSGSCKVACRENRADLPHPILFSIP